ncbi:MAG: DUF2892 domain-containing protein [Candidatus Marinimicrobia bacterium]|nr:DUF2892 domain-containing protein [Candidatus Neomarinimicrobiota bacterium]MCF7828526.1 DUF2892 domain-containing protein [Candidatus Neomarinimicrobiota bacterium]MCF7882051.1 DUF2892 domain-containing protein [Candidatus Neomarinimicrobiota bacterium]
MNENTTDRVLRVIIGLVLLAIGIFGLQGTLAWILGIVGGILAVTGLTGFCLLYKLLGISTKKATEK